MPLSLTENLAKIEDLTRTVTPFRATIVGNNLLDSTGNKKGILFPIAKDKDIAVAKCNIEAGFIHTRHCHDEYEIVCLLSGAAVINFDDEMVELKLHTPFMIDAGRPHEVCYLSETKILAITIPASPDFPDTIGQDNGRSE